MNTPLRVEKERLIQLSRYLQSIKVELKAILRATQTSPDSLPETQQWLDSVQAGNGITNAKDTADARHAANQIQAELAIRQLGLEASVQLAQSDLEKLQREGAGLDVVAEAKNKEGIAQTLLAR